MGEGRRGAEVEEADGHPLTSRPAVSKVTPGVASPRAEDEKKKGNGTKAETRAEKESTADAGSLPGAC